MGTIILIVLLILFVVAPVIAALIALVHAIIDSISKKRFPNIIAMALLLVGIVFLAFWLYGDHVYNSTEGLESLCFFGLLWFQIRFILQALTLVFSATGLTWYIFLSFREDSVPNFRSRKASRKKAQEEEEVNEETAEEIRESNRRTARLYRTLTIIVSVVLSAIVLLFLYVGWYLVSTVMTHELTEFTSPDGEYTIIVDNLQQGQKFGGDIYLRLNSFKVRKLKEKEGRRKFMDIQYEDITWEDQGIRIPYGKLDLFYYYEPDVTSD